MLVLWMVCHLQHALAYYYITETDHLNGNCLCCSHGEALTIEPLMVENKEESFLRDMSILAVATVTQVMILTLQPELRGLISLPIRVCTCIMHACMLHSTAHAADLLSHTTVNSL